jgi:hypothetical protein
MSLHDGGFCYYCGSIPVVVDLFTLFNIPVVVFDHLSRDLTPHLGRGPRDLGSWFIPVFLRFLVCGALTIVDCVFLFSA